MTTPDRHIFLELADQGKRIPLVRTLLADFETPLSAYWKLCSDEKISFLLESVTGGEQVARYSVMGFAPQVMLRSKGRTVRLERNGESATLELGPDEDPLHVVAQELGPVPLPLPELPAFTTGAVGVLGYDLVRFFETLPEFATDDLELDDVMMGIYETLVVVDHVRNQLKLVHLAEPCESGFENGIEILDGIEARLKGSLPALPGACEQGSNEAPNWTSDKFESAVQRVREFIFAGDGIQMVISQRFARKTQAHPIHVYRALRTLNPSPYMFLLRFGDVDVVGASPELLMSLKKGQLRVRPIAGTRPRGQTEHDDQHLAEELLQDEKECAEHLMLVDLGRNDIGRVSDFASVQVGEFMAVERYSHVMHIVSDVTGNLREGLTPMDAVRATFPAGTLSGAPKVRAMEIIEELEPTRRGIYGGAVGYFSAYGDVDLAIAIRTAVMKGGVAYVQAGAGIVADSVPSNENRECQDKARSALAAIQMAESGLSD